MAKNTASSQAANAANVANTGVSAARNLVPGITAIGDTAGARANTDYGNVNNQVGTSNNILGSSTGTLESGKVPLAASENTYGQMASTGGFTPQQETNYLDRATSGVGNAYQAAADQAKLQTLRTGAASGPAAEAQIARQGGQAQASALENAQAGLTQQENANKLAGAGGLVADTSANTGIGGAETGAANTSNAITSNLGSLYGTNLGAQQGAQGQLLQDVGTQLQGAGTLASNAGNFGKTLLQNYVPSFSVPGFGFGQPAGTK